MTVLECKGLTKTYGRKTALDNIDLTVPAGRVVGLLGPNGSGKTTLIKLANGLLTPSKGEVLICGEKPGRHSKALVSYLPDRTCLPDWMNERQLMDFYQDFYPDFRRERAEKMLQALDMPDDLHISQMSKGTREKIQLIMVMSRDAKLYLLDEPIGGVDPATRDYIINTIIKNYAEDSSVIISTHLISDVENALDDVIFIDNGRIRLHSPVDDIREQYGKSVDGVFREVFRCSEN